MPQVELCKVVPHFTKPKVFLQQRTRVVPSHQKPVLWTVQKDPPQVSSTTPAACKEVALSQPTLAGLGEAASSSWGSSQYGPATSKPLVTSGKVSPMRCSSTSLLRPSFWELPRQRPRPYSLRPSFWELPRQRPRQPHLADQARQRSARRGSQHSGEIQRPSSRLNGVSTTLAL